MSPQNVATTLLLLVAVTRAGEATTRPLTDLKKDDLAKLASADPIERENAWSALADLTTADLPALQAAVKAMPLRAESATSLREAMVYVLNRELVSQLPKTELPFMGLLLGDVQTEDDSQTKPPGVVVRGVLPGFAAARCLQAGDILVGLVSNGQTTYFQSAPQLMAYIATLRPGAEVTFDCRRAGRPFIAQFKLDTRPGPIGPVGVETNRLWALAETTEQAARDAFTEQYGSMLPPDPVD